MGFDEEWGHPRTEAAVRPAPDPADGPHPAALRRLAEFRDRVVLVPFDERGGLWTTELGGLDWICAFSDEEALSRFALARGEAEHEWPFRRVRGARLLDEVVAALDFPCGVALDPAGPAGAVFPPVLGIVADTVAVDGEAAA
ncbi:SseB family protein [Streptomyces sp. NPDC048507]|uniref:SseB family protein n=1 Tax=Streptomyces sp. NPDC048507 TaxID=3365560 RepID=UPI003724AB76